MTQSDADLEAYIEKFISAVDRLPKNESADCASRLIKAVLPAYLRAYHKERFDLRTRPAVVIGGHIVFLMNVIHQFLGNLTYGNEAMVMLTKNFMEQLTTAVVIAMKLQSEEDSGGEPEGFFKVDIRDPRKLN
jgi:hypothetical protein